ncbi:MAG TPA: hypothetical protein VHN11_05480 [Xanthobacteraceae bacterium]|jgi:hypothetical protein|nr:hypothetical protein [Xanthobacteraceae bacterium]
MTDKQPAPPKLQYQDNPNLSETFADSIGRWIFDGNTLRIDFTVARIERPDDGKGQPIGKSVPACRLVLTANGAVELLNRCRQLTAALEKAGLVKEQVAQAAKPEKTN